MKLRISFLITVFILIMSVPSVNSQNLSERSDVICSQLDKRSEAIKSNLSDKIVKITETRKAVLQNLKNNHDLTLEKITDSRSELDAKLLASIEKLRELNPAEKNKIAIDKYSEDLNKAMKDLRVGYDKAYEAYVDSLNELYENRLDMIDQYADNFIQGVNNTLSETKSSCQVQADSTTIRRVFVDDLKQNRLNYGRNISKNRGIDQEEITKNRVDTIKSARHDFEQKIMKLNNQLKIDLSD